MIDAAERAVMTETIRAALVEASGIAAADEVLGSLGWLDLLEAEPADAIDVVFSALGATDRAATALDDVLLSALGTEPRADLAMLLPRFATWEPPGRREGEALHAHGLATARAADAVELMVIGGPASDPWVATIAAKEAEIHAVRGIDPDAGFHAVRVEGRRVRGTRLAPAAWQSALALGRRAVAHQIAGASRAMLALARSHALERVQFGRPIAQFQAVRHRLADALVAVEALEATLGAANDEPNADTAALAKAVAGRTAQTVASHCQQVLAGIGFTTEHPFHRYLKRTLALEGLFGSADEIALDIGRRLLVTRRVPTLIELR
jgi:hypothetical protein